MLMDNIGLLLFIAQVSRALGSQVTCFSNNTACDVKGDNFIGGIGEITTAEECRHLCQDRDGCKYFTHFDSDSFPLQNFCQLYSSCEETSECQWNCVSESSDCWKTCGFNAVGPISSNFLNVIANVESESDCKMSCVETTNCTYYTYYLPEDSKLSKLCYHLTELLHPLRECPHCMSGPAICNQVGLATSTFLVLFLYQGTVEFEAKHKTSETRNSR